MEPNKYLSSEHWARVVARAWIDPKFKDWVEEDPVAAIKSEFEFEFDHLFQVPPRPINLTDVDLTKMASGSEPVITHMTI